MESVQQARQLQLRAKEFFERSDFEEAFPIYQDAEKLYRNVYGLGETWVIGRIFFMQSTALRCLEGLLDQGRVDFLDAYDRSARQFFNEWNEQAITSQLNYQDRRAAQAFWLWRKSYFHSQAAVDFAKVAEAANRGDFEIARKILDDLIESEKVNRSEESDALCAIARSKKEILRVKAEFRKPESQRDLAAIAAGYKAAADVSQLHQDSTSAQRPRIAAYRDWFLCNHFKFLAFGALRRLRRPGGTNPLALLEESEKHFVAAIVHARNALDAPEKDEFPENHLHYLKFWQCIVSHRINLFDFMIGDNPRAYDKCLESHQEALRIAQWFEDRFGKESLFPNVFYSLKDLELEKEYCEAAHRFRYKRWDECVSLLTKWRSELPIEFRWSWRDIQVYIRLLLAEALKAVSTANRSKLASCTAELSRLRDSEPIGNVGRLLVSQVEALQTGIPPSDEHINFLFRYFPLDSYTDTFQPEEEFDPLVSLPLRVWSWLEQCRYPASAREIKEFKVKLRGCVDSIVGHIYDFHLLRGQELPDFDIERPNSLVRKLSELVEASFSKKMKEKVARPVEEINRCLDLLHDAEDTESYLSAYLKLRSALERIVSVAPVVIEIQSAKPTDAEPKAIMARPDWATSLKREGRDKVFLFCDPSDSLETGRYYLPSDWRKGNRLSYATSVQQPLLRVGYKPAWDYWETEAAKVVYEALEGVSDDHLTLAIELAKQSEGEPKVGAVIVKNGEVLAAAYRKEFGFARPRHAEAIAIKKCLDSGSSTVGAILITTLEPCTPEARGLDEKCCGQLIVEHRFSKVIYGDIDRNRKVRGSGHIQLETDKIPCVTFPARFREPLWKLNKAFFEKHVTARKVTYSVFEPPA